MCCQAAQFQLPARETLWYPEANSSAGRGIIHSMVCSASVPYMSRAHCKRIGWLSDMHQGHLSARQKSMKTIVQGLPLPILHSRHILSTVLHLI